MELQIPYNRVYRNPNKSGPWIYQKGKIMFHMTFPSDEACDLDKYSIRTEVQTKNVLRREQGGR